MTPSLSMSMSLKHSLYTSMVASSKPMILSYNSCCLRNILVIENLSDFKLTDFYIWLLITIFLYPICTYKFFLIFFKVLATTYQAKLEEKMLDTKKCIFYIYLVKILSEFNIFCIIITFNNSFKACFSNNSKMQVLKEQNRNPVESRFADY